MKTRYRVKTFLYHRALSEYLTRLSKYKKTWPALSIITKNAQSSPRTELGPHNINSQTQAEGLIVKGPAKRYFDSLNTRLYQNLKRGEVVTEDMIFTILSSFKLSTKQISRYVKIVERGGAILITEQRSKLSSVSSTYHKTLFENQSNPALGY